MDFHRKLFQLRMGMIYLARLWEMEPGQTVHAQTLYSLIDRVHNLEPEASEQDLWGAVHQAREDGRENAERWKRA